MNTLCRLFYRVPFSETDAMKIVHHSNHAKYLERGRVEFLRLVGLDYASVMARGIHFPLTNLDVSFKKPLVFDEILMIETSISELTRVRLNFSYRVFSVNEMAAASISDIPWSGTPSFQGETKHCSVNDAGRPIEIPADIHVRLTELFKGNA